MASVTAVAVVSGAIELLKSHIPVLSLGVLYLFAVLPRSGLGPPPAPVRRTLWWTS